MKIKLKLDCKECGAEEIRKIIKKSGDFVTIKCCKCGDITFAKILLDEE